MSTMMTRSHAATGLVVGVIAGLAVAIAFLASPARTTAQVPPTDAQALAVEQQLLCPVCTNERLDVCALAICRDMKQIIRERLEAGASPDDIILYFETRYGPKVRAELEPRGFNLWLYGWITASTGAVAVLGGWFLYNLRRRATQPRPTGATPSDEWLDAQIADDDDRNR